jgi:hypothetical protein
MLNIGLNTGKWPQLNKRIKSKACTIQQWGDCIKSISIGLFLKRNKTERFFKRAEFKKEIGIKMEYVWARMLSSKWLQLKCNISRVSRFQTDAPHAQWREKLLSWFTQYMLNSSYNTSG